MPKIEQLSEIHNNQHQNFDTRLFEEPLPDLDGHEGVYAQAGHRTLLCSRLWSIWNNMPGAGAKHLPKYDQALNRVPCRGQLGSDACGFLLAGAVPLRPVAVAGGYSRTADGRCATRPLGLW